MEKRKTKIIAILMLVILGFGQMQNIQASFNNSSIDLGKYRIYYREDNNRYLIYRNVSQRVFDYYYLDRSGIEYPAYCVNLGMSGAEDTENGYDVDVYEKIQDPKLSQIMLNGYPYKTIEELGLKTQSEAKFATQFAVWAYISNLDFSKMQPTNEEYRRVLNSITQIYENGISCNINEGNYFKVLKEKELFEVDKIDDKYYSNTYKLDYNENIKDIKLKIEGKTNTIITDVNNKTLDKIVGNKQIKILIPREDVTKKEEIKITFDLEIKETSVMFGLSTVEGMQNTALTLKKMKTGSVIQEDKINYEPTMLKIIKIDKDDNNIRIPNVKFKLTDVVNNKVIGEYTTNKQGEIILDIQKDLKDVYLKRILVEEIDVPDGYYIDMKNNKKEIALEIGKENAVTFENEKIKGKIKIYKTSKDDNMLSKLLKNSPLQGTVFNILDSKGKIVDTVETNEDGIAISKELLKGKYIVREIKSSKYYVLNNNSYEVEIKEHNKEESLNIQNDNIEYSVELPKTGR